MSDTIKVCDVVHDECDGFRTLSASVDGERLYIQVPDRFPLRQRGEYFVGIGLLAAMSRNLPIVVDESLPVSRRLIEWIKEIQGVYSCWNSKLNIIDVEATIDDGDPGTHEIASFFSGGVDSSHTLYRHMDTITHLIMCRGFDTGNTDNDWKVRIASQTDFADRLGVNLVPVVSNARQWFERRGISWLFGHGLFLASLGPCLGYARVYIPSSHTYSELIPWGSHPLTDPMWSTESTEVIHEGAQFRRGMKMKDLCKNDRILDNLQVCWESTTENCGKCAKCVRLMIALRAFGKKSKAVPELNDYRQLKALRRADESGLTFIEDAMLLSEEAGDTWMYRILRKYWDRHHVWVAMTMLDKHLFGGPMRRLRDRFRPPSWKTEGRILIKD